MPATAATKKPKEAPAGAESGDGGLFLIDGNSLAYRAFFALPESIATADGRPTNAIYGFASMMAKILIEHRPSAVIVAWDAGMSGREVEYEEYKSQRKPRPDLLSEQWPHLAPLAEAFGFHNVKVEGWEADDVIATLVRQAREAEIPVMVVSGDRDVYQVVDEGIRVMTTSRGVTETKIYDREGVVERYGVPPELKQNLTEHADDARVSKQLATLKDDVEVPIDVSEIVRSTPDRSRLREFAAEFELRAVMQRLDEEFGEIVPERRVEETIEVEAEEGRPGDLTADEIAIAVGAGRWAASDGERVVTGEAPDLVAFAEELRGRSVIAHDAKSLGGGGRTGLLAVAPPGSLELQHDTIVAAYLIDPARRTYDLHELAADAGLAAAPAGAEPGQLSLAAEEGEAAGDPTVDARLTHELAARQRERLDELGL